MALTKDQKTAQVEELTKKMSDASSIIYAHYIGLNVAEISDMRSSIREKGAEMKVAKKTLMKIAAEQAGVPLVDETTLDGPVSIIFSYNDPLSGAQAAFAFGKTHKQVELIGGVYDGKLLSKNEATELAKMPGREQLLRIFAGMIRSPLVSFASACSSPLSGFARALDAMAEKGIFTDSTQPSAVAEEKAEVVKEETEEPKKAEDPQKSEHPSAVAEEKAEEAPSPPENDVSKDTPEETA